MRRGILSFFLSVPLAFAAFGQEGATPPPDGDLAPSVNREEIERLRKIIMEEQEVIAGCMKRIDALEQAKTTQEKNGLANLKISGDFRYRYDYIHQDLKSNSLVGARGPLMKLSEKDSRDRHRLRLRLGFDWKVNEEMSVGALLATTMNGDPVSYNQTLTGGFSKKDIWLDMAFFDYHPKYAPGVHAIGGKMKNPFYAAGKTQMIWDQDLTPEGLVVTYTNTMMKSPEGPVARETDLELTAVLGYFQVEERPLDVDTTLFGVQGQAKYNLNDEGTASILGGLSYYDYGDIKGFPPLYSAADNFGNALSTAILGGTALYADDFNLIEGYSEFTWPVFNRPLTVFGDVVYNTAATDTSYDEDKGALGWATGISYGRCVTPRSFALRYEYRDTGRNAVVGAFADSDFAGGGTNSRGHIIGAEFMVLKNTRLSVTYFINHNEGSDLLRLLPGIGSKENVGGDYQRLLLDLNIKF